MKKLFYVTLLLTCYGSTGTAQQSTVIAKGPSIITGTLQHVSEALRDMKPNLIHNNNSQINKIHKPESLKPPIHYNPQAIKNEAVQTNYTFNYAQSAAKSRAGINANFNGMSSVLPDPSICVGPNHIIQMVNGSVFTVYDKNGNKLIDEMLLRDITKIPGYADPITLYDQLADRFIMVEVVSPILNPSNGLAMAVSQTSDPTGKWYTYFFNTGNYLPDFPKFSVWGDAYYGTSYNFDLSRNGQSFASIYAFNRAKLIAGERTVNAQIFNMGYSDQLYSLCPVLWQGTTPPPAGTGGLFAYMYDNYIPGTKDSVGLLECNVNFSNPAASRIRIRSSLEVAAFTLRTCDQNLCVPQPIGVNLNLLYGRISNQPVYRNFGNHEGIVMACHANNGNNIGGIRWYELHKTGNTNWKINQQSTYSPDATFRIIPSICYDKYGNIGLAYNVSGKTTNVYPGIRFTGRKACDPLNVMTIPEQSIVEGSTSITDSDGRFGDYNHLVADAQGNSFWFTAEWSAQGGPKTRIASFSIEPCNDVPVCNIPAKLTSTNLTSSSATLSWAAVPSAAHYTVEYKLNTATAWNIATASTTNNSVAITNLSAASVYDWRVKARCIGANSDFANAQFTTTSVNGGNCPSNYDNASNDDLTTSPEIPLNMDIKGVINNNTDNDYYRFFITATGKYTITLQNLASDYDIRLFNLSLQQIGISQNYNVQNEVITRTLTPGAYFIRIYGWRGANSPLCYTAKVAVAANGARETDNTITGKDKDIQVYPKPATQTLNVVVGNFTKGIAINVYSIEGQLLLRRRATESNMNLYIGNLAKGAYVIKVSDANNNIIYHSKFTKQ